jgi:hypothetical protein
MLLKHSSLLLLIVALPAQTWTQRLTASNPGDRPHAAAAFAEQSGVTVVFGRNPDASGTFPADTWLYNGANWAPASPSASPPGRGAHAMAYDLFRDRVVLFGGLGTTGVMGDTWEWDGTTWVQQSPAVSPPARLSHCMAFDLRRGVTVLFGGTSRNGGPGTLHDTWEWNGTAWTQVVTAAAPAASEESSMCYDLQRGVCVLTGGTSFNGAPDQKTWEYDGVSWTDVSAQVGAAPSGTPGVGVAGAQIVYDRLRRVSVLFGGRTPNGTYPTDTWEYDGRSWRLIATLRPAGRTGFVMTMDLWRNKVLLYGGVSSSLTALRDTEEFSGVLPAYDYFGGGCSTSAGVPSNTVDAMPRIGHTMIVRIGNLPAPEAAVFLLGFSNTTSSFGPLPFDMTAVGAPGCFGRVRPDANVLVFGANSAATVQLAIPNTAAYAGMHFFTQALALQAGLNALGMAASDAVAATIGQ